MDFSLKYFELLTETSEIRPSNELKLVFKRYSDNKMSKKPNFSLKNPAEIVSKE